ncbi:MAG: response regulator transcription factor [Dehalococcoidales bacterium]
MVNNILIVDDEPTQIRMFTQLLSSSGYHILKASGGREAVRIIHESKPDLVLLDVVMPEMDGWQTCRMIRDISEVPIIMLTGKRNSEADIVQGLEAGADDYLSKPVGNRELLARVKAALRRAGKPLKGKTKDVHFSDDFLCVDVADRNVTVQGKKIKLTPREFSLLALLVKNAGHVVSHQQVLEHVWGFEYINDVDYVRIYVAHLRQKIEPDPSLPKYILTETGVGYCFHSKN